MIHYLTCLAFNNSSYKETGKCDLYLMKKKWSTETFTLSPDVEFYSQRLQSIIINIFRELKKNMFKALNESMIKMYQQIKIPNKEVEIIFKKRIKCDSKSRRYKSYNIKLIKAIQ